MIDDLFTLLAARPRRRVLVSLLDAGEGSVPTADVTLTRGAAARSSTAGRVESAVGSELDAAVGVPESMRHVHLPKLDESDLVEWDDDAGTVARGPRFAEAEPFLRLLVRNQHELPGHLV
jgi:hypothetical protein